MYVIMYGWFLPPSFTEEELIHDFESIKSLAANHGALSSHLFRSLDENDKFVGVEVWPSKEIYANWFDGEKFIFLDKESEATKNLIIKIKDVYKNRLYDEASIVV